MSWQGRAMVVESNCVRSGSSIAQRLELVTQLNMWEIRHMVMGYINWSL